MYGRTHKGGDIELVKANMKQLAEARHRTGSQVNVQVCFHRYLGNMDDAIAMKSFAEQLGFHFAPAWAILMPLDKVVACLKGAASFDKTDNEVLQQMAFSMDEVRPICAAKRRQECSLLTRTLSLDVMGNVQVCCAHYYSKKTILGRFMEMTLKEVQQARFAGDACKECMETGAHVYAAGGAFARLASRNVMEHYRKHLYGSDASMMGKISRALRRWSL